MDAANTTDPLATPREYKDNPFEKQYAPKVPVDLDQPLDKQISPSYLAQCDGSDSSKPTYVAIKGTVFDVSKNKAYQPGGSYHVFAGKDPSRALASSSLKAEDCVPDYHDLADDKMTVLNDWYKFFSKRYNIVGQVGGEDGDEDVGMKKEGDGVTA